MAENTDRIKEKIDIADLVSSYVRLSPAGKNLKGLCPFHKEKTPSFIVSRDRQSWRCFGCGLGGDIFSFIMQYENLEFVEALKILAERAGVPLQLSSQADDRQVSVLYDINRIAKDLFRASLEGEKGKEAVQYLLKRGLKKEIMEKFELGLSSSDSDYLIKHLTKLGYSIGEVERAGLAVKSERGLYWDRFRNRIMFPIHNHFGKVVGFTGRILPAHESEKIGKYVNSPETPIFNKSKLLFGFFLAKNAIREKNQAVLVEGQMDLLMLHQDGILNSVATSGTSLTTEHAKVLRRFTENIVLAFDNDKAGKAAAERAIDLLESSDYNVKLLLLGEKDGKDPADVVLTSPGKMRELVDSAVPAMEYYFEYFGLDKAKEITAKKKSVRSILAKIKQITSQIEQSYWLGELSMRSGLSQEVLQMELALVKAGRAEELNEQTEALEQRKTFSRQEIICQRMIALLYLRPDLRSSLEKASSKLPETYKNLIKHVCEKEKGELSAGERQLLSFIQLRSSLDPIDEENIPKELELLDSEYEREWIKERRRELSKNIRILERTQNIQALEKALHEFQSLTGSR